MLLLGVLANRSSLLLREVTSIMMVLNISNVTFYLVLFSKGVDAFRASLRLYPLSFAQNVMTVGASSDGWILTGKEASSQSFVELWREQGHRNSPRGIC